MTPAAGIQARAFWREHAFARRSPNGCLMPNSMRLRGIGECRTKRAGAICRLPSVHAKE